MQQKGESDEVMVRCISGRLADSPGISYSHIASKAYDSGRTELAIKVGRRRGTTARPVGAGPLRARHQGRVTATLWRNQWEIGDIET